jgi:hypothetical protein
VSGNPDVDAFIATRLLPEQQEIAGVLRELVAEQAPELQEVISSGSPAWKGRTVVAIISHSKTHLTFAFSRGADFEDPHGLLEGVGKKTRHVKIKKVAAIDRDALRDYVAQAVRLDG